MIRKPLFLLLFLLAACTPKPSDEEAAAPFFDLDAFFKEQVTLQNTHNSVEKTIVLNADSLTKKLGDWNASRDLGGFRDLNINRPAWRDQYQVDSIWNEEGNLQEVHYAARDSSLRIREVAIEWEEGEISKVYVEKYIQNRIVYFHQQLTYWPDSGYHLTRVQKVPLTKRSKMEVRVAF